MTAGVTAHAQRPCICGDDGGALCPRHDLLDRDYPAPDPLRDVDEAYREGVEDGRRAQNFRERYDLLREAARWAVDASTIAGNGPSQEAFDVREDAIAALRAALSAKPAPDPLREDKIAAKVAFTADEIDAALKTIRGGVTYEEATIMAAASAAASALRTGGRIVPLAAPAQPAEDAVCSDGHDYERSPRPLRLHCRRCGVVVWFSDQPAPDPLREAALAVVDHADGKHDRPEPRRFAFCMPGHVTALRAALEAKP